MLRGWAANELAEQNKTKGELLTEFNRLESIIESRELTNAEHDEYRALESQLEKIWHLEEIKAKQRSRDRNIKEGDRNTAYFQALANERSRRKKVDCLESPVGLVYDQKRKMEVAVKFYKDLFAKESDSGVRVGPDF